MKKIVLFLLATVMFSLPLRAAGPGGVRKTVESSMLVTGWVLIDPAGDVEKLELDQRDKLPEGVVDMVEKAGATWRFEPTLVDGVARRGRARMSLRIVAKKVDADHYEVAMRSGYFGDEAMSPKERIARADSIKPLEMNPPHYPKIAAQMGARGTVYLVLKVGQDGTVKDLFAEQVNLQVIRSSNEMERMRRMLAQVATSAARSWTFLPPTEGEYAQEESWSVRVPVDFQFHDDSSPQYGQWNSYVPGPKSVAPWDTGFDASQSPDAMIAGVLYDNRKSRRLLTPLHPG